MEAVTRLLHEVGVSVDVLSLHQTSLGTGNDSEALTLLEYRDSSGPRWVAGRDRSVLSSTVNAILSAARSTLAEFARA